MKIKNLITVMLIASMGLFSSSAFAGQTDKGNINDAPEIMRKASKSIVKITICGDIAVYNNVKRCKNKKGTLTGVFNKPHDKFDKIVITSAAHYVDKKDKRFYIDNEDYFYRAFNNDLKTNRESEFWIELLACSGKEDIAIFEIINSKDNRIDFEVVPLKFASSMPEYGDWIIATGYTLGLFLNHNTGHHSRVLDEYIPIHKFKEYYMVHTAIVNPGQSGGPALNLKGEIVGINLAKFTGPFYDAITFAMPLHLVREYTIQLMINAGLIPVERH